MEVPEVDVPEVDVDELEIALIQGGVLIDVREAEEFEDVRVPGARLIPLAEVAERRGSRVYVICAKGGRSRVAAGLLREDGTDAVNVVGGTTAWLEAGKTVDSGDPV